MSAEAYLLLNNSTVSGGASIRPTREQILAIKANFISMRDSQGRVMLSWLWPVLPPDVQQDWLNRWRAEGLTHVVVCPVMQYPGNRLGEGGIDIEADWRAQPARFAAAVTRLLDEGFIPIVQMTSGDGGTGHDVDVYWSGLLGALDPVVKYCVLSCGFEVVGPGGGWTSAQLSRGLTVLGWTGAVIGVHLQPERATGASHPVEPDDPWQGDEAGFWKSHGGELADVLLYQTPHGSKLLAGDGWEDRWIEILDRLGIGARGWRKVHVCAFEKTGYDYYHGACSDADVVRTSNRARDLATARGVTVSFGDGLPK